VHLKKKKQSGSTERKTKNSLRTTSALMGPYRPRKATKKKKKTFSTKDNGKSSSKDFPDSIHTILSNLQLVRDRRQNAFLCQKASERFVYLPIHVTAWRVHTSFSHYLHLYFMNSVFLGNSPAGPEPVLYLIWIRT